MSLSKLSLTLDDLWRRRLWLRLPLRMRLPVRRAALWLGERLNALATWLDYQTVGTAGEAFDAMERLGQMLADEGYEWSEEQEQWVKP